MDEITLKALAKINLGLDVVRRREDGYAMYIPAGKYIKFSVCVGVGNTVNDLDFRKIVFN